MASRRIKEINDIVPFYFKCVECGTKSSFHGDPFLNKNNILNVFDDWIDTNELDKIPIYKDDHKAREVIKNIFKGEVTATISKLQGICPSCKEEIDINVWIKFQVEDRNDNMVLLSIEEMVVLDGDRLIVGCMPGFYRGVDIADGLHKLYLRWWFLEGDIYVFCPFIDGDSYEYFDQIGNDILITYNCIISTEKNRQPFKMITARNNLWDYQKRKRTTIEERVKKFMKKIEPERDFMLGSKGEGVAFIFPDCLYGVETLTPKDKAPENFKTYFHAKMYGALTQFGRGEMVLTSYNYVDVETMQLESLSFVDVDEDIFMKQIYKFQDDPHMQIEQPDLSDI